MIPKTMEAGIRRSSALVLVGLLVEAFSLIWNHPTAFIVFAIAGGGLIALGILVYLLSLLIHHETVASGHVGGTTDTKQ